MSDDEVSSLRRDLRDLSDKVDVQYEAKRREIKELSDKSDRQHEANQRSQERDRETFKTALGLQQEAFAKAMASQRDMFQDALNKQFIEHFQLDKKVDRATTMLENAVGDGQPGKGRVGILEEGMETMKKFRWQALAVIAFLMWAAESFAHHSSK